MTKKIHYLFRYGILQIGRMLLIIFSDKYRREWHRFKKEVKRLTPKGKNSHKLLELDKAYTKEYFASRQFQDSEKWAIKISEAINKVFHPKSIVDFGAGKALFMKYFYDKKIKVHGFEGSMNAINSVIVPKKFITHSDFRKVIPKITKKYDLAISFEVAEHIERDFAAVYLHNLTNLSDTILFTAAEPYFSPKHPHHPNEQFMDYWQALYAFYGFTEDKISTKKIKKELEKLKLPLVMKHYEKIVVFKRNKKRA